MLSGYRQEEEHQMMQHELGGVHVLRDYNLDTIGAPFKVTLANGVTVKIDKTTGKELVQIPDLMGLLRAVVRARVMHDRKLSGEEIKFIRHSLGLKSKVIAEFLDMSAENFSRIESGKALTPSNEKLFRLSAYFASCCPEPRVFFTKVPADETKKVSSKKIPKDIQAIVQRVFGMKFKAVFEADEELSFSFMRRLPRDEAERPECGEEGEEEDTWRDAPAPELEAA
jgi:transcriptional regulator with XRE-family HTH domain